MIDKESLVEQIRQLPTIPQSVIELQKVLAQPNVSIQQVEKIIRADPALTANVLRFANSAAFGLSRKVADISHAITLLGFKVLGNLVNTAGFSKAIPAHFPGYHITAKQFLQHSYAVAVLSEALAAEIGAPSELPIFTAGLLHDIGKLALGTFVERHDQELCRVLEAEELTLVAVERKVLGVDHGQVAAWVGEQWRLPAEIVAAAELHHCPDLAPEKLRPIVDLVHVADITTHCFGFGADLGELARSIHAATFLRLNLTAELLEKVASSTLETVVQELPTDESENESPPGRRSLNILVVDDSAIIRKMVGKSLALAGLPAYSITEAGDGVEALSRLEQSAPAIDLVLADIHMPKMTGLELVRKMSSNPALKDVPVVIISSDGNTANHDLLRTLGVRALLKKPFRPEQIRTIVQPLLAQARKS